MLFLSLTRPDSSDGSDDFGEPLPLTELFSARADVEVKSGKRLFEMGEQLTEQIITCLMWYDPRAVNSGWLQWQGREYEIQHIKPDGYLKSMMITAKVIVE